MNDNLQAELVFSYVACWALQWLKAQKWFPFVVDEEKNWNKAAAAFLAFIGSAGILISTQHLGPGDFNLHITGLTWNNIMHIAGHGVRLYGEQKLWFKTVVASPSSAMVASVNQAAANPNAGKP